MQKLKWAVFLGNVRLPGHAGGVGREHSDTVNAEPRPGRQAYNLWHDEARGLVIVEHQISKARTLVPVTQVKQMDPHDEHEQPLARPREHTTPRAEAPAPR